MGKRLMKTAISMTAILIMLSAPTTNIMACVYDICSSTTYGGLDHNAITRVLEVHGYSLIIQTGDAVIIRANHPAETLDPFLRLESPEGYTVASAGVSGTRRAEIATGPLAAGNYTVTISDLNGNGKGEYFLSVQSGNRPANARKLRFDEVERDSITGLSEMKAYKFDAKAGETVSLQMIAVSGNINPHIRFYGPTGLIAQASDYDYAVIPGRILPDSGTYSVIVCDNEGSKGGGYFLILSRLPLDVDEGGEAVMPTAAALNQNYPNPFNPQTTIEFNLPRYSVVSLTVFNIMGERVRTLVSDLLPPGRHTVTWDGTGENGESAASGIYFYRLAAGDFIQTRKMLLLK